MQGLGSLAQGLAQGYQVGSSMKMQNEESKLKQQIAQLKAITDERKNQLESEQMKLKQESDKINLSMQLGDKYLSGLKYISNPSSQQTYLASMKETPWFKEAPDSVKSAYEGLSKAGVSDVKDFQSIYKEFEDAYKNNDKNGMATGLLILNAKFGNNDNFKQLLSEASKLVGLKIPQQKETNIGSLLRERNQFAPGSEEEQIYSQALSKEAMPSKGITINTGDIEKSTKSNIEKNYMDIENSIVGLKEAKEKLNPKILSFLSAPGQMKAQGMKIKRFLNLPSNESDEKAYDQFLNFASSYMQTIGEEIHRLYGAALTKTELARLESQFPQISTSDGWKDFLKTDPGRTFISKLDATIDHAESISKRYQKALNEGRIVFDEEGNPEAFLDKNDKPITLNQFSNASKTKAQEMADMAKKIKSMNPTITNEELEKQVLQSIGK